MISKNQIPGNTYFKFVIVFLFFLAQLPTFSQNTKVQFLECDTISSIGSSNQHLVDAEVFPEWRKYDNKIYELVTDRVDTSWWTSQVKELVEQWKNKNNITDDRKVINATVLYHDLKNNMFLEKMPMKQYYLFSEIGGGYKIENVLAPYGNSAISKIPKDNRTEYNVHGFNWEELHRPIFCAFDSSIYLNEGKVLVRNLEVETDILVKAKWFGYDSFVPENISLQFEFNRSKYEFVYKASLCSKGYSFNRNSTISPVYYNNVLTLKNVDTKQVQVIYKTPDYLNYRISGISIGDINGDNIPDVFLSVSSDSGRWRLVYLSNQNANDNLLEYVGFTKIYFIAP